MAELLISGHARERYAERAMDKNVYRDAVAYVATHTDQIDEFITKMVEFGEEIFCGKSFSEYNKAITKVYLKDSWVIIVDAAKNKVITLYKIDLGLGEQFNKEYIIKLMDKLKSAKEEYADKELEILHQKETFQEIINQNTITINENRRIANELEKQNSGYVDVIKGFDTQLDLAYQNIREIMGTIVGRKVY